jgi:hypothetical protein
MTGRVVVMRLGGLVTADADADGIHHEQQRQGSAAVDPRIGGHGWDGRWAAVLAVSKRYQRLPPWSTLVKPDASAAASASVQRVELTPNQVAERVVHVIEPRVLVRLALVAVALQLQALDHATAALRHL